MSPAPFSIVINTDARRDGLDNTLRSLRYLDYRSFEVCVVYGPTPDGTKELLESYRGEVKVRHCPERNLSMSRNIGIAMAAGEYVAFIDDDAFPEAEWLRDLERGYDDAKVAGSGGRVYDHTGWRFQYGYSTADRLGNSQWDHVAPAQEFNFPLSERFPYLQGTNASFRRSALLAIGGFDEEFEYYLDETDLCCRLVDAGYVIRQLPDGFVHHKFLPSGVRNQYRVVRNRFPVIKNKIYFSIVNNHGHHGMNEVIADANRFISHHAEDVAMHARAGRLSGEEATQFWRDVDRAWEHGLASGLRGQRSFLNAAKTLALESPFVEFPRPLPDSGRKVFCFLSKEYPPGRTGGIGTYTESAAGELARLGHHVHVLSEGDNTIDFENGVWVHRLKVKKIEPKPAIQLPVPDHIWNYAGTMREELYRIDRRRAITAVESPIWDVEGIALACDGVLPHVVSLHTTLAVWLKSHDFHLKNAEYMDKFGRPILALERHLMLNATGIHANSKAIEESCLAAYELPANRPPTRIIHHGILDPAALPRAFPPREQQTAYVLFVGRLERRKGIDVLLAALAGLLPRHPEVHCDVVGDDTVPWDEATTFRKAFADRPIAKICEGHVQFHGKVPGEAVRGFLARADILVVPSRFESFGLTVLEGFAFAKAVVATRAGGLAEIVRHRRTGILVDPDDVAGLAAALEALLAEPQLRAGLGRAARLEYEQRFSGARMVRDLADFLGEFERATIPVSELTLAGKPRRGVGLWGEETGIMLTAGDSLEIPASGRPLHLSFWRHPWSGVVRVLGKDGILAEWDLYSAIPHLCTYTIVDTSGASLRIRATGKKANEARGAEVIFYRAAMSIRESPLLRLSPPSRAARLAAAGEPHGKSQRRRAAASSHA